MLDEMRRGDWTPRSVHRNARLIADTIAELEAEFGRDIKDFEVAEKLDISLDEYHHMLTDVSTGRIIGIEDLGVSEDVLVTADDRDGDQLYEQQANEAFNKALVSTISSLPEREALVLSLYYNEELNLKEIGAVLDVSESRISQIHSQALVRLKARMQAWV
jgi:RNA polymerase sigma factor for flagellar operon FliA